LTAALAEMFIEPSPNWAEFLTAEDFSQLAARFFNHSSSTFSYDELETGLNHHELFA
jgi:hypothetical protein